MFHLFSLNKLFSFFFSCSYSSPWNPSNHCLLHCPFYFIDFKDVGITPNGKTVACQNRKLDTRHFRGKLAWPCSPTQCQSTLKKVFPVGNSFGQEMQRNKMTKQKGKCTASFRVLTFHLRESSFVFVFFFKKTPLQFHKRNIKVYVNVLEYRSMSDDSLVLESRYVSNLEVPFMNWLRNWSWIYEREDFTVGFGARKLVL